MQRGNLLKLEDFCRLIADELQLDVRQVTPQASFIEDLMVDSIHMVELMLRLEEQGVTIPFEEAWEIRTVEDAYRCYRSWIDRADRAGGDQEVTAALRG